MIDKTKITSFTSDLANKLENFESESLVFCYGHFNIIHPGHIRYLQHAKSLGKKLYIALLGDALLTHTSKNQYFSELERANGIASLDFVDRVLILDQLGLDQAILKYKPKYLVLGKEFQNTERTDILQAKHAIESISGKIEYHAGEIHYASADLLHGSLKSLEDIRRTSFIQSCKRQNVHTSRLLEIIRNFKDKNLLVIGDTIVDQYVACDAIGMSAEAPVLVVKELESREFVGGAGIVSSHVKSLGANCRFLSVVGNDENSKLVEKSLTAQGIKAMLIQDSGRPTTFKIRYMVENQKLFRVSRLKEHSLPKAIEDQFISCLRDMSDEIDGILVCDFVYGVITPRIIEELQKLSKEKNIKLFGDLQCSSQVGNITKFEDFYLLCPTEREARIALSNQEDGIEWIANTLLERTRSKHLLVKLGAEGFVTYTRPDNEETKKEHFPALISNPVDVAGAGDSLLAAMATALCAGANIMEASAIGACMAALAVQTVGNIPVSQNQLIQFLNQLETT